MEFRNAANSAGRGTERSLPETLVCGASAVGAAAIFAADFVVPADIRLHGLYVFPVAIAARYCGQVWWSLAVLILTTALQFTTYSLQVVTAPSAISDVLVPFATSLLTLFLARAWRTSYLAAVHQATTDPLTELPNRRAFVAEIEAEIARQRRQAGSFSLAVLDLDGFKALNDSKGHRAGDEALRLVAAILQSETRATDLIGRIGGDEFGILMPDTAGDCTVMLRDLCAAIARTTAAADCAITTSIGCKTFRAAPENAIDALQQADAIMYSAKMSGRNRAEYVGRDSRAA